MRFLPNNALVGLPSPSLGQRSESPPLIFIFLGSVFPRYAALSLRLNTPRYHGPTYLIVDEKPDCHLPGEVTIIRTAEFYDSRTFSKVRDGLAVDPFFRAGFWLKAVERFFVLNAFLRARGINRFFHAELDVLILNLTGFAEDLDRCGQGLFIPEQRPGRAMASVIYGNSLGALDRLTTFLSRNAAMGNEMKILAELLRSGVGWAHAMPSEAVLLAFPSTDRSSTDRTIGVVDAADIGHWLFGYDPRNLHGTTWNKYLEGRRAPYLTPLLFKVRRPQGSLHVRDIDGTWLEIRAIHVHAKIFWFLQWQFALPLLVLLQRLPFRVPIVVQIKGVSFFLYRLFFTRRFLHLTKLLPQGSHQLLSSLVDSILRRAPQVMSNGQRAIFNDLLPKIPCAPENGLNGLSAVDHMPVQFDERLWNPIWRPLPLERKTIVMREAAFFLQALRGDEPIFFSDGPCNSRFGLIDDATQWLFTCQVKHYEFSRQVRGFWAHLDIRTSHCFMAAGQLFQPEFVRQMFPDGEKDIASWVKFCIVGKFQKLSAFQAYGTWVYSQKPGRYQLGRLEG